VLEGVGALDGCAVTTIPLDECIAWFDSKMLSAEKRALVQCILLRVQKISVDFDGQIIYITYSRAA
jgi:hypothetical protein